LNRESASHQGAGENSSRPTLLTFSRFTLPPPPKLIWDIYCPTVATLDVAGTVFGYSCHCQAKPNTQIPGNLVTHGLTPLMLTRHLCRSTRMPIVVTDSPNRWIVLFATLKFRSQIFCRLPGGS
jgi:hypothetical protein